MVRKKALLSNRRMKIVGGTLLLFNAAEDGYETGVRLFLEKSAEIESLDRYYRWEYIVTVCR